MASGSCEKGNIAVSVDCIVSPLGILTEMPCSMGTWLTQGFPGPMKCLVQPESTMAWRSADGLRAGNKVLQENKLFKTKESLGLTVLGLCQGARLCTTFFVVTSSILLVACRRSGKVSTGVVAAGAACPAVVVRGAAGGLDTCSAELFLGVGDGNIQLREVLQGDEDLGVGGRAVYGEGAVGCSESCYRGAITGCGRREVCDGFDQ